MRATRITAHGLAAFLLSLSVACSGRACGSARPAGTTATGSPIASTATDRNVGAEAGGDGPGLRRQPIESLALPAPRSFDLSHVEPAHFAAALGKDPSRIFEYVRDNIAFESYAGCLRGPRGTLLAMAGNSVDRAALLGSLLQQAGFRVRYVRGTLADALARPLAASIWAERPWAKPASPGNLPPELKIAAEQFIAGIQRDSALLRDSLKRAGVPARAASPVTLESLVKEAQDHYWVEWWKDGAWTAMDPSWASAAPGWAYATSGSTWDSLPETLFHRVIVRVRVEEYAAGKTTSREVLRYAANAPDLAGVDLILAHQPTASGNQGPSEVKPFLVVGGAQIHGAPFSLKPAQTSAAVGAMDALGGGPEESPLAAAESVEMEFLAPDGRREVVVREIFDRIGKSRRASGDSVSADSLASGATDGLTAGIYDFLITTGAIDAWHLRNLTVEPEGNDEPMDVGAGLRRVSTAFCAMSDLLTSRVAGADGPVLRSYLETPRVQVSEWAPRAGALGISLDLRRDAARVVTSGDTPDLAFRAQVLRGVVSGHLERLVIEYFTRARDERDLPVQQVVSTSSLFDRARAAGVPFTLLTHDHPEMGADLPADARARMDEAIGAGQWIVAPVGPVQVGGVPRMAWWEIDAGSGATIGVTDEGLHQAVEAVIVRMDGRGYSIAFRVNGRFISTGGRLFRFQSRAQAEQFVEMLGARLTNMGMEFNWFAI